MQAEMALEIKQKPSKKMAKEQIKQTWPTALPDQVCAVAQVLSSQPPEHDRSQHRSPLRKPRRMEEKPAPHPGNPGSPGPCAA